MRSYLWLVFTVGASAVAASQRGLRIASLKLRHNGTAAGYSTGDKVAASVLKHNASSGSGRSLGSTFVPTPHLMSSTQVLSAVLKGPGVQSNRYAVNFGAGDGLCMVPGACGALEAAGHEDPTYPLFHNMGFGGVAVEGNPMLLPLLKANLPADNISKVTSFVTPFTSSGLLAMASTPADMDYFKNDLDSYDCAVLYSVLKQGFRPKVVQVEVNPEIPYPVVFGVNFAQHFKSNLGNGGFYGCSVTLAAGIMQRFHYDLVAVSLTHDVIFVRRDLLAASGLQALEVEAAQEEQAKCCLAPDGYGHFGANYNYYMLDAHRKDPEFMLKAMKLHVEHACKNSQGTPAGCAVPYTLSLDTEEFLKQYEESTSPKALMAAAQR